MSIRWLPRELGMVVSCDGTALSTDVSNCTCGEGGRPVQFQTAAIIAKNIRAWLKKNEGWGRGVRKGYKRNDLCPAHLKIEIEAAAKAKADREAKRKDRDEKRRAEKLAKLATSSPPPSPSAASAQAATS